MAITVSIICIMIMEHTAMATKKMAIASTKKSYSHRVDQDIRLSYCSLSMRRWTYDIQLARIRVA